MAEREPGRRDGGQREGPPRHIGLLLARGARQTPDAPAILAPGRAPLTWRLLAEQAESTRQALRALGIGRGDRVAIAAPDGPELAVAILTIAAAATAAPLNPEMAEPEFARLLRSLRATALVAPVGSEGLARAAARRLGLPVIDLASEPAGPAGRFALSAAPRAIAPRPDAEPAPGDIALLLQTSGTTGLPKIVPLTHANLCGTAAANGPALGLTPDDRCVSLIPMHHIYQIGNLLTALTAGGSVVCLPGFDPAQLVAALDVFQPTWITGAPAMHLAVLDHAASAAGLAGRAPIRFLRSGGASLPPAALERIERAFAAPVLEGYGLTETSPTMTSNPLPPRVRKAGSVGVPVGCEIRVVDEADEPLPAGLVGEVIVRGPNVMAGYLDDPDANAMAFTADGWLRTGDLGSFDPDGYLFLTGRLKEMINRGGQKVSPLEVEATLREHPAVAAATVFALPDDRLGEEVAAAIVARDGMTIDPGDLRAFVTRRLAWHKAPRRIVVVDRLPTTRTGKPRRVGLAHALGLTDRPDDGRALRRFAAPRTAAERAVAEIWAQILGQPRIGRFDRLLDLGGDSLAAVRIVAGMRDAFGVELSLAGVLDHLDVAAIAAIVEARFQSVLADAASGASADG